MFSRSATWTHEQGSLDEQDQERFKEVAKSNSAKLSLFEQILAAKKTRTITHLVRAQDELFERLLSPERIRAIRDEAMLFKLLRLVRDLLRDDLDFIGRVAREGVHPSVHFLLDRMKQDQHQDEASQLLRQMPPQKREQIRQLLGKLEHAQEAASEELQHSGVEAADDLPTNGEPFGDGHRLNGRCSKASIPVCESD